LALFAPLVFSGFFFYNPTNELPYAGVVFLAFVVFCALTSTIYILNDLEDYDADRNHPFKKKRPIASGELPKKTALFVAGLGILFVALSSLFFPPFFGLLVLAYFGLQLLYIKKLKHIPILDVASIATGFLIRVYAGAMVVEIHTSVWFLLTVISASLFLAVGKRQSERTLLLANHASDLGSTRKILTRYSQRLLDQYTGMFANATWLTYALFAFQDEGSASSASSAIFTQLYSQLPRTLHSEKLLMLSVPFVIFGVMRYLQLVYESNQGESPEKILLQDKSLLGTVFTFGCIVMIVIYFL
jgi:4-hydroxybenzoate polyprenyltransferase